MIYTAEDFIYQHEKNENFDGKRADFSKMQALHRLKESLSALQNSTPDVKSVEEIDPERHSQNTVVCMDVVNVAMFGQKEITELIAAMKEADRVIFSTPDSGHVRISFGVENIWSE